MLTTMEASKMMGMMFMLVVVEDELSDFSTRFLCGLWAQIYTRFEVSPKARWAIIQELVLSPVLRLLI
jgi:hypothetical protein